MNINIKKLSENAIIPTRGTKYSAGSDLYACLNEDVIIAPGETKFIGCGISLEIPENYAGLIYARSGMACKMGLAPANKVGVIDSDYRGEIMVALHNHSDSEKTVSNHDRIAQLVVTPFLAVDFTEVTELSDTVRGEGGFGSTGKN